MREWNQREFLNYLIVEKLDDLRLDIIDLAHATAGRVKKSIKAAAASHFVVDRIIHSAHRLHLPNIAKSIRAMKLKRNHFIQLENEASSSSSSSDDVAIAKQTELDDKNNKKEKHINQEVKRPKQYAYGTQFKIGKATSWILQIWRWLMFIIVLERRIKQLIAWQTGAMVVRIDISQPRLVQRVFLLSSVRMS